MTSKSKSTLPPNLPKGCGKVWLALELRCGRDGKADLFHQEIMDTADVTRPNVADKLAKIVAAKLLTITQGKPRKGCKGRPPSTYTLYYAPNSPHPKPQKWFGPLNTLFHCYLIKVHDEGTAHQRMSDLFAWYKDVDAITRVASRLKPSTVRDIDAVMTKAMLNETGITAPSPEIGNGNGMAARTQLLLMQTDTMRQEAQRQLSTQPPEVLPIGQGTSNQASGNTKADGNEALNAALSKFAASFAAQKAIPS